MRKLAVLCSLSIITFFCGAKLPAQDATNQPAPSKVAEAPVHFYHLEFVVQELGTEGKPVNSRAYTVDTNTDRSNRGVSVRTGSRIRADLQPVNTRSSTSIWE